MEYLDIIDEKGNYTGEVVERNEAQDRKLRHWKVATIVINDKMQVLLQKRNANKKYYPDKWAWCAGLVISGESLEEAAMRELQEELGISISKKDLHVLYDSGDFTRIYYVISNKKEEEFIIQEEELSSVKWFDIDEILSMIENNDNSIIIKNNTLMLFQKIKNIMIGD